MEDLKHLWITGGGMIFFKLGIPKAVRHHFRTERGTIKDRIVESTGTDSKTAARSFRDQRLGYWRAMFEHLKAGGALGDPLPMKLVPFSLPTSTVAPARFEGQVQPEGEDFLFRLDRLLEQARGKLPPQVEVLSRDLARAIAAARYGLEAPGTPGPGQMVDQPAPIRASGETFYQALAAYLAWLKDEQQARVATVAAFKTRGQKFINHAGDLPLSAITYDVAKGFIDHVATSAGNGSAANDCRKLCHTVFEYARERRKFDGAKVNPFKFRGRKHVERPRAKFTAKDLHALFGSPTFTKREIKPKKYNVRSALPWVAAIGLYTGARIEEICQLRRQDLHQETGIWVLDITPDAGKLKTVSSERKVPVHSALKALGLLDYHRALPKSAARLFPNLPAVASKGGKVAPAVGKAFGRWRKAVGVHRPPEQLDFHSFRHTFTKALEDIGVSKNDADRLTGHEVEGISFGRYSGPELKRLAKVIERVRFEV
jgi:integrase